jgi:hypoxanthine phosphoribosyltransferase
VTAVVAEAPTRDHPGGGRSQRRTAVPVEGTRFAHASEAELARILDFYMVRWEYEPRTFPILWNLEGQVVESFSPDFYLPDLDLWVELTTLRQSLVRRKNRKLRRMRELYPMVRIKLLYARDFRALMLKYGRLDVAASLIGADGQVVPAARADGSAADVARSSSTGDPALPITVA